MVAVVVDVNESRQPYRRGEFALPSRMVRRALEIMVEGLSTITNPPIDGVAAMNNAANNVITLKFSMVERIIK